jgi:hypothetical protein
MRYPPSLLFGALALVTARRFVWFTCDLCGHIITALGLAFRNGLSEAEFTPLQLLDSNNYVTAAGQDSYSLSNASSLTCALTVAPNVLRLYPPSRHETILLLHALLAHCFTVLVIAMKSSSSSMS